MKEFKPFKHKQVIDLEQMNFYDVATHGDLSIVKIKKQDLPKNFDSLPCKELGVLAEGEAHAHAHQLFENSTQESSKPAFELLKGGEEKEVNYTLKDAGESMFLVVENTPLLLKHQTHNPFRIHPGYYDVGFQQEQNHFENEIRRVID